MIVDRYELINLCELIPSLRLEMDADLAALDRLLEDDVLFQRVKADLSQRYPNTPTLGRHSTPVEVILSFREGLVVRRLYDWSYEQTEHFVSDSLVLRQFCRLYLQAAPDDSTLIRWAALIGPETLEEVNERVVALARSLKVTRGRKLRTDGTVVETNIHHPSDNSLLSDGVRVLGRLVRRAKDVVGHSGQAASSVFRDRSRSAKRLNRRIVAAARQGGEAGEAARRTLYRKLLQLTEASLSQVHIVRKGLESSADATSQRLVREIDRFMPLVEQVVGQTYRRVMLEEAVPTMEKIVSLFEPHTRIIRRGKAEKPTEFGRKVWLDEVDGGIVSSYRVLEGNPPDAEQLATSLAQHQRLFGRAPDVLAGDRGVYSAENELLARQMGVKRVALPKRGAKSPERRCYERQGWFRRALCFRAGVEGRISVLKRRGYLGRCRDHGENSFSCWVGWGVITANLATIARKVAA